MTVEAYQSISEIYREDIEEFVPPLEEWQIQVVDRDVSENLGDLGGRDDFVANARVRVTEPDGSSWEGLAVMEEQQSSRSGHS